VNFAGLPIISHLSEIQKKNYTLRLGNKSSVVLHPQNLLQIELKDWTDSALQAFVSVFFAPSP